MQIIDLAHSLDEIEELFELFPSNSRKYRRKLRELERRFAPYAIDELKRYRRRFLLLIGAGCLCFSAMLVLGHIFPFGPNSLPFYVSVSLIGLCFYFAFDTLNQMRCYQAEDLRMAMSLLDARMDELPKKQQAQIRALLKTNLPDAVEEEWDEESELWIVRDLKYGCLQCGEISHLEAGLPPVACPHCGSGHFVYDSPAAPLTPELMRTLRDLFQEEV